MNSTEEGVRGGCVCGRGGEGGRKLRGGGGQRGIDGAIISIERDS